MAIKIYLKTDNVRIILAKKNMRLSSFACKVGVSCSAVSMWFSHKKCPSELSREKIQEVLGKTRQWDDIFITEET